MIYKHAWLRVRPEHGPNTYSAIEIDPATQCSDDELACFISADGWWWLVWRGKFYSPRPKRPGNATKYISIFTSSMRGIATDGSVYFWYPRRPESHVAEYFTSLMGE